MSGRSIGCICLIRKESKIHKHFILPLVIHERWSFVHGLINHRCHLTELLGSFLQSIYRLAWPDCLELQNLCCEELNTVMEKESGNEGSGNLILLLYTIQLSPLYDRFSPPENEDNHKSYFLQGILWILKTNPDLGRRWFVSEVI